LPARILRCRAGDDAHPALWVLDFCNRANSGPSATAIPDLRAFTDDRSTPQPGKTPRQHCAAASRGPRQLEEILSASVGEAMMRGRPNMAWLIDDRRWVSPSSGCGRTRVRCVGSGKGYCARVSCGRDLGPRRHAAAKAAVDRASPQQAGRCRRAAVGAAQVRSTQPWQKRPLLGLHNRVE